MKTIQFIIFSNILVSISAGMLSMGLSKFFGIKNEVYFFLTVFFATLFIYNFQRILRFDEVKVKMSERHIWLAKNKKLIYFITLIGFTGAALSYFFLLKIKSDLIFLCLVGLISVFYALKTFKNKSLRDLPLLKIHIIALIWVLITAVWPLIRIEVNPIEYIHTFIAVYLYIIAITIPFDIRDLAYDNKNKKTFPQLFGVKTSKRIAIIFLFISFTVIAVYEQSVFSNLFYYVSLIGSMLLILQTTKNKKELYFSGWIDGWIIFIGLLFWTI